jgi:hypothetical protein
MPCIVAPRGGAHRRLKMAFAMASELGRRFLAADEVCAPELVSPLTQSGLTNDAATRPVIAARERIS